MSKNEKLLLYVNGLPTTTFNDKLEVFNYIKTYTTTNHYPTRIIGMDNGRRDVQIYLSDDEKRTVTFYIEIVKK